VRPAAIIDWSGQCPVTQSISSSTQCIAGANQPYQAQFTPQADGALAQMTFQSCGGCQSIRPADSALVGLLRAGFLSRSVIATASVTADFVPNASNPRGNPVKLVLDHPALSNMGLRISCALIPNGLGLTFSGAAISNETGYRLEFCRPFWMATMVSTASTAAISTCRCTGRLMPIKLAPL